MRDPREVVLQMETTGVVGIVRAESSEQLIEVIRALHTGGLTCVEVTMTTPNALGIISQAARHFGERLAIGVGTVLDAETARAAILAGAEFIVSPIVDLGTIRMAKRYSRTVLPGAFTPTEIVRAWQAGADIVKVFPATKLGPQFFKDIRGPLPHIKLTPTGGVDLGNVGDFIKAGAVAVGVGGSLIDKQAIANHEWPAVAEKAAAFLAAVRKARQKDT